MPWTPYFTDTFTRANGPIGNGWVDPGSIASIVSNVLNLPPNDNSYNGSGYVTRPVSENLVDQQVTANIPAGVGSTSIAFGLLLRAQGTNTQSRSETAYVFLLQPLSTNVALYAIVNGGIGASIGAFPLSASYNNAHAYSYTASVVGINPTTIAFNVVDTTTSTTVCSGTASDNTPSVQAAGALGVMVNNSSGATQAVYSGFTAYTDSSSTNATGYTLTPSSSSGTVGTINTITANLTGGTSLSSTLVITLIDSLSSTISGTITITNGLTSGSATINPSVTGTHSITATHTGGGFTGGDGSTSFLVSAPYTIIGVNSTAFYASPFNWDDNGTGNKSAASVVNNIRSGATECWTQFPGAYLRIGWTTTGSGHAVLLFDTTHYGSISSGNYPIVKYRLPSGVWYQAQVPANGRLDVTNAGISGAGTYQLLVVMMASIQTQDRYGVTTGAIPANSIVVTGLEVDSGSTLVTPTIHPSKLLVFSDSIGEGVRILNSAAGDLVSNDSTLTWIWDYAQGNQYEVGFVCLGAWGYQLYANGGFPNFTTNWQYQSNGRLRDTSIQPNLILECQGTNDYLNSVSQTTVSTDVSSVLTAMRAAYSNAIILKCVPFGGFYASAITTGYNAYQAATADNKTHLYQLPASIAAPISGPSVGSQLNAYSVDGIHPNYTFSPIIDSNLSASIATITAVYPSPSNVINTASAYGPDGNDYTPTYVPPVTSSSDVIVVTQNTCTTSNDGQIFTLPQYLTAEQANYYFANRLSSEVWFSSSPQDQNSALIESTRAIDNLNYLGTKYQKNQILEFPRWQPPPDSPAGLPAWWNGGFYYALPAPPYTPVTQPVIAPTVPQEVYIACCENAILLLDGFDFELEIRNLSNLKSEYAQIRETYDRGLSMYQLRSGIASAKAWNLLKPWFADTLSVTMSRVS